MPTLRIDVGGLEKADTALRRFARTVDDLRPFWRELGQTLADDAQSRWPLKRTYPDGSESRWSGPVRG